MQIRWLPLSAAVVVFVGALGSAAAFAAGDSEAGKAQAIVCAACHGQDGATGLDPTYPNLAGQNEKYLYNQLIMIQNDDRPIALMAGQLIGKSDADLQNLAAYYASLPGKIGQAQGDDDSIQRAEQIYRGGILKKGVAACSACHSPSGAGNRAAGFPVLTGQPSGYTIAQLTAYREGERRSDESLGGMMRGVAGTLTDGEIAALADYLQGLH
ncbi:MAG: cytochrome c4 [Gammaproteobacteria bacterium]|nr:cytochrome c4 [Gammaproteobacteria bacterium]